jgi:uncharacterized membrane protein
MQIQHIKILICHLNDLIVLKSQLEEEMVETIGLLDTCMLPSCICIWDYEKQNLQKGFLKGNCCMMMMMMVVVMMVMKIVMMMMMIIICCK